MAYNDVIFKYWYQFYDQLQLPSSKTNTTKQNKKWHIGNRWLLQFWEADRVKSKDSNEEGILQFFRGDGWVKLYMCVLFVVWSSWGMVLLQDLTILSLQERLGPRVTWPSCAKTKAKGQVIFSYKMKKKIMLQPLLVSTWHRKYVVFSVSNGGPV